MADALVYLQALPPAIARSSATLQRWTYREIWRAARAIARTLLLRCPHADDVKRKVGVMIDDGPLLPIVELAVLLAEMVIIPLDAGDPRVRFIIEDATPDLIITKDANTSQIAHEAIRASEIAPSPLVLTIASTTGAIDPGATFILTQDDRRRAINDKESKEDKNEDDEFSFASPSSTTSASVSHIFFTSGSTGRPKGCVVAHSALLSYCRAKSQVHRVDESSVCFVASSLTFDPSLGDFFSTWCSGGVVALAPRSLIFSSLGACLSATHATHLLTSPSLFSTITRPPSSSALSPASSSTSSSDWLPELRVVALGGEPMPRGMMEAWSAECRLSVINTYGVTECCVYQTAAFLRPDSPTPKLLGDPLPGNQVLVMRRKAAACDDDEPVVSHDDIADMRLVAEGSGEEGELWIAGDQVGQGYLNMPELTARKFVVHPTYGRCFRTGDLVAAFPAGAPGWKLVGRSDGQVKISGQRVELGEIEEALLAVASPQLIHSAAVVLSSLGGHGQRGESGQLVAYCCIELPSGSAIAAASHEELLSELLRLLCEERLPRHMVPSRFVFVASLPTTRTGKIARALLAKQDLPPLHFASSTSSQASSYEEAGQSDEVDDFWRNLVAATWGRVLGLEGLVTARANAHFMELGGDSLAALRVCQSIAGQINDARQKKPTAEVTKSTAKTKAKPSPKATTGGDKEEETAAAAGEFGELLGPLAPAELLKRPRLWDFARHLREAGGDDQSARQPASSPLAATAELRSRDAELLRMLYRAVGAGAQSIVRFLLDHRCLHPDGRQQGVGAAGGKATAAAASKGSASRGAGSSGARPASASPAPRRYLTPLHVACANGHANVALELLARGASPTIADPSGVQPIHLAAQKGPVEVLDALLTSCSTSSSSSSASAKKAKAAVNPSVLMAKDDNQQTVLHHAARADAPGKVMDHLLEKWMAAGAATSKGTTTTATKGGRGGATTSARGAGGSGGAGAGGVDCVDRWRRTPLHWAVVNGHRTMVAKLLECGADRKKVDDKGETPLAIAERRARCGAKERPEGMGASVFGDIAKLLGGSGSTKRVSMYTREG